MTILITSLPSDTGAAEPASLPPPRATARKAWLLVLILVAVSGWLVVLGAGNLMRAHLLWRSVRSGPGQMVGPVLVAVVATMFIAERYWPSEARSRQSRAHLVDAVYMGIYAMTAPAVIVLNSGFALGVSRYAPFLILRRLPLVPQLAVIGLILVGMDGMNWVAHMANHRSAALWRFHALHHSQEQMSVFTTFRTHPLTHVSYLPALLPAVVLEGNGAVPAAALVAYGCLVAISHANVRWTYGRIGRVAVSPAFHRLHHANTATGGQRTVNFGFVLAVWDRLAGTASWPVGSGVQTGLTGRPVPVEQQETTGLVRLVATQLIQPLRLRSGLEES